MEQNYVLQGACLYVRMPAELDHETGEEVKQTTDKIMAENHVKKIVFDFGDTVFMRREKHEKMCCILCITGNDAVVECGACFCGRDFGACCSISSNLDVHSFCGLTALYRSASAGGR